ncbi:hypothetical protein AVEN_190203-1 [Araneus ventricosus]|uniref:Uncharacterized protein n=1 Tax=Araneus ventricosus TaxID=182803 RepID=A0A4Y2R8U4_ARAVE|nr:hypothetical protein AVEN_190203-1 [Araneus ventricosus]
MCDRFVWTSHTHTHTQTLPFISIDFEIDFPRDSNSKAPSHTQRHIVVGTFRKSCERRYRRSALKGLSTRERRREDIPVGSRARRGIQIDRRQAIANSPYLFSNVFEVSSVAYRWICLSKAGTEKEKRKKEEKLERWLFPQCDKPCFRFIPEILARIESRHRSKVGVCAFHQRLPHDFHAVSSILWGKKCLFPSKSKTFLHS